MKKLTVPHLFIGFVLALLSTTPVMARTLIGGTEFEPNDGSSSFFIQDEQPPSGMFPSGANNNDKIEFIGTSQSQSIRVFRNTDTNTYPSRNKYDATKNTYLPSDNASKTLYNSKYVCTKEQWNCGDNAGSSFNTVDRYVFLANTREEEQNAILEYKISDLTPESKITVTASLNNYSKSTSYDGLRVRMILMENGKETYSYSYKNNNGYIKNSSSYIEFTISDYTVKSEEVTVLLVEDYSKANGVLMLDYIKVYLDYEPEPLPDPLPDAIVCDEDNIHEIFFEDFGQLPSEKSRKRYNSIDGVLFSTSYNFKDECLAIQEPGDYAIVANPRYSGCTSTNSGNDYENTCYCDPSAARLWYKDIEDHTPGDTNGGMMQFDCKNGHATDILYERTIKGVCSNTLVNFSAWITKANVSNADKFKARFLLRRGGADGPIIGRKDVEDIDVNQGEEEGWQFISAMFNSGDLNANGEVTVQLINLAPWGQNGNDLLLDDLRLTVCTPHASLKANYGGALVENVEKPCDNNLVELVSDVETSAFTTNYYLWQQSTDGGTNWNTMPESGFDVQKISVASSSTATLYRLIVANNQTAAELAAKNVEQGPCGLYAITNAVRVVCLQIELSIEAVDDEICTGDEGQYIIKVTNPFSRDLTDLVIKYEWPSTLSIDRQHSVDYGRVIMPSYQWAFDGANPLPAGKTATLSVKAISTGKIDMHGFAYLESFNGESYLNRLVSPLSKEEIIWVKYIDVKAYTEQPTYCEGDIVKLLSRVESKCESGEETIRWQYRKKGTDDEFVTLPGLGSPYLISLGKDEMNNEYRVYYTRQGCACNEAYSAPITIQLGEKTAVPTDVTNYDECASREGVLDLTTLVHVEHPENLVFYPSATAVNPMETVISTNQLIDADIYFTYTEEGKCTSDRGSVHVILSVVPTAGLLMSETQRVCADEEYEFTISATAYNGTGAWSVTSGEAVIADPTAATTTATVPAGTTAVLAWTVTTDKGCTASCSATLIVDKRPQVTIVEGKGTQSGCATSEFTVAVNPDVPAGRWKLVSGSASIASPTSYETKVTNIIAGKTVQVRYDTGSEGRCAAVQGPVISLTNLICNDFQINSSFNTSAVCLDDEATLTVSILNKSSVASTHVKTNIVLPEGLVYIEDSGNGSYDRTAGVWTVSAIEPNTTATLEIKVKGKSTSTVKASITEVASIAITGREASASLTVNALPTALFTTNNSKICASSGELTNAQVTFTGASTFDLTYMVNVGAEVTKTGLTSPYTIEELLRTDATLQLVSVKDANGCVGTVTGQSHQVTADNYPTIQDITAPAAICEGSVLNLTAPSVADNGSTLGTAGWVLDGASFDPTSALSSTQDGAELKYVVAYTCGRQASAQLYSNGVAIAVDAKPSAAVAGADQTKCNNDAFVMAATVPTQGRGEWSLVDGTANIQEPASATTGVVGVPVNGSATLQWTVSNGVCPATSSTVVLTNNECTNLNITAGTAPVVCDGGNATFTFTLTNNSTVVTSNVISSITLGAGLSDVNITTSNGTISGNTWTVASMAPGDKSVLTVVANATTTDASVHVVVLTASGVSVAAVSANQVATVNAMPTASFESTSSTICIDPQDKELTNIAVNFTGAAPFELTYVDSKGSTYVENNLPLSTTLLNADLDADEAYTLVSVTDANGCVGTITGQTHRVTAQKHATLGELLAPEAVCEGSTLTLVEPTIINNNGAVVSENSWVLNNNQFDVNTAVTYNNHNGKELYYQITSSCNGIERNITSNTVPVTVHKTPELSVVLTDPNGNVVTNPQINCAVPFLTATLSGADSYVWNDGSTANPRTLGKKGQTTTYEVAGASDAGCASTTLKLTVTEDFVAPEVSIVSNDADNTLTCAKTAITLTASSNTAGVIYQWDDANETIGTTLTVDQPNTYKVTATNPINGCYAAATHTIGINKEYPIIAIASVNASNAATTTITCTDTELTLTPSVSNETIIGAPVSYTWADDATLEAQRVVADEGRYTVAAQGANGCQASVFIDIDMDDEIPNLTLSASVDTLTCLDLVSVLQASVTTLQGVTYEWSTGAQKDSIHVRLGGEYSVVATALNGCQKEAKVTIEQRTDLPEVTLTSSDAKQYCRVNTLTADGAISYVWNTNETTSSIEVSAGGTYWVEGTNRYGCTSRVELLLEEDKQLPVVSITKDIESITCNHPTAVLTAKVTNNIDGLRTYTYQWSPQSGTSSTLRVTQGNTYKVVVTDKTNFCVGEKTLEVKEHTEKPMVDVQTLPAVCLPATIDLTQAVGPKTLADKVVFFEDEAMTKEVINTTIDVAQYKVFYVQGQQVNGNGCMGDAQVVAVNLKAETPAPIVKDYDECTKAGSEKFSSLVTSGYYKLSFYASENDETPIADAFDASLSNTTTTYYVSNTNLGACESQRVPFTVHIEGLVDFEMEVSDEEIMIGDDAVTITLIPASVDVNGYRWMANGKELQVDGEAYTTPLYVNTQFEIAAQGRCNTLVKEATVVVNWPTAFTPYNNNGLNESFAKGLPVAIFNRFGIQIFEGPDGWDGVMNKNMGANTMALPGVYYYSVSLPDGNVKKGTIEIVKF